MPERNGLTDTDIERSLYPKRDTLTYSTLTRKLVGSRHPNPRHSALTAFSIIAREHERQAEAPSDWRGGSAMTVEEARDQGRGRALRAVKSGQEHRSAGRASRGGRLLTGSLAWSRRTDTAPRPRLLLPRHPLAAGHGLVRVHVDHPERHHPDA